MSVLHFLQLLERRLSITQAEIDSGDVQRRDVFPIRTALEILKNRFCLLSPAGHGQNITERWRRPSATQGLRFSRVRDRRLVVMSSCIRLGQFVMRQELIGIHTENQESLLDAAVVLTCPEIS